MEIEEKYLDVSVTELSGGPQMVHKYRLSTCNLAAKKECLEIGNTHRCLFSTHFLLLGDLESCLHCHTKKHFLFLNIQKKGSFSREARVKRKSGFFSISC